MQEDRSIAGVVEYIERCRAAYNLDFVREPRGADEAAFYQFEDAAERLTDFYFPPDYMEFLRLMGEQTPVDFAGDATMNWKELWKVYDNWLDENAEIEPNILIVAANGFNFEQLALECALDENGNTVSGRVRYAADGSAQYALADGFVKYLFCTTFVQCDARDLTATATYYGAGGKLPLDEIAAFCEQFGWRKHWFSDSINLCVAAPDNEITVYARQRENHVGWLRLCGRNQSQVAHVGEQIARIGNLKFERWWN